MKRLILRKCDRKQRAVIDEILSSRKYIAITTNPEEGTLQEITNDLNYEELFYIYRKLRKRYFKKKQQ